MYPTDVYISSSIILIYIVLLVYQFFEIITFVKMWLKYFRSKVKIESKCLFIKIYIMFKRLCLFFQILKYFFLYDINFDTN